MIYCWPGKVHCADLVVVFRSDGGLILEGLLQEELFWAARDKLVVSRVIIIQHFYVVFMFILLLIFVFSLVSTLEFIFYCL